MEKQSSMKYNGTSTSMKSLSLTNSIMDLETIGMLTISGDVIIQSSSSFTHNGSKFELGSFQIKESEIKLEESESLEVQNKVKVETVNSLSLTIPLISFGSLETT